MTNERYKMIPNLREEDFSTKQEGDTLEGKNSKGSSSTSTPWSRLKDPRIVRVSRAFGGKDRHSKVCTVRGLRDRRIRLSVPTAIQLYDLQDRLGLNQPSKVVDWLLNAAKAEIDELPPLQIPPGSFGLNHQQLLTCHDQAGALQSNKLDGIKINNNVVWDAPLGTPKSNFWNLDAKLRNKSTEIAIETGEEEEENWNQRDVGEKPVATENHGENVSSINFFPVSNHSSLLNNPMLYHSYYRLDPSNFPLHQVGRDEIQNFNVVPFPSTLSQVRVCPPGTAQSYFPSHFATSSDIDPKK